MTVMLTTRRTYEMFENQSLWETAARVHEVLAKAEIPHAVVGGVAVCLHGYQRNTVDLDLLVRPGDSAAIQSALTSDCHALDKRAKQLRAPSGIAVRLVMAGDKEVRANRPSSLTRQTPPRRRSSRTCPF
jgi:hypothetical protein